VLIMISIFGALGGLVMTFPRLVFSAASRYRDAAGPASSLYPALSGLASISARTAVPAGAIAYSAVLSCIALIFFGSFSRIVNFIVVPIQAINILMVAAVFKLRRSSREGKDIYRTPGYPLTPLVYIVVMTAFLLSAIYYRPLDTLIGVAITSTGIPVYHWIGKKDLA
jgi:APA family basic amino acid/polyamine antiporter